MKRIYIFAIIFVAANVADALLTWGILMNGGAEVNPIMSFVFGGGLIKTLLLKTIVPVMVALIIVRYRKTFIMGSLAIAFIFICAWNTIGLMLS